MSDETNILLSDYEAKQLIYNAVPKIIVDKESCTIIWCNEKASVLFGSTIVGELNLESFEILIPELFRAAHAQHWIGFWHTPKSRLMSDRLLDCRRCDGTEFRSRIALVPCKHAGRLSCLVIFFDDGKSQ